MRKSVQFSVRRVFVVTVILIGWLFGANTFAEDAPVTDAQGLAVANWRSARIGGNDVGGATLDAGTLRITSGGERADGTADSLQFVYQACTGNVAIVARMLAPAAWGSDAFAGITVRNDLRGQAANLTLGVGSTNGLMLRRRADAGEVARPRIFRSLPAAEGAQVWELVGVRSWAALGTNAGEAVAAPIWLKLERRGDQVASFCSRDGVNWQWLNTDSVKLRGEIVVGVVATRRAKEVAAVVEFDQLSVQPLADPQTVSGRGTGTGLRGSFYNLADPSTVVTQKVFSGPEFRWPLRSLNAYLHRFRRRFHFRFSNDQGGVQR